MSTGSITTGLSGLLGDSSLGPSALGQQTAKSATAQVAAASQTDVYTASQTRLLLSNTTYTNFGILQGTTSQTGTTGQSRYVDATLAALAVQMQMKSAQQSSIMSDLDQYGGISVSGTNYPNALAPSEAEAREKLESEGNAVLMEKAVEDAQKEQEAADQEAQESAAAGTDTNESEGTGTAETGTDTSGTGGADAAVADPGGSQEAAAKAATGQTPADQDGSAGAAVPLAGDAVAAAAAPGEAGKTTGASGEDETGDGPKVTTGPGLAVERAAGGDAAATAGETDVAHAPGEERIDRIV